MSDSVYINSKPETKALKEESGNIYNPKINIYYVTEPCYNENSKPSKLWILVIEPIWLIEPPQNCIDNMTNTKF